MTLHRSETDVRALPSQPGPLVDATGCHVLQIRVEGLPAADTPEAAEWPSQEELLPLLLSRPGRPVTQQDIEADVVTLLSTGGWGREAGGVHNQPTR